MTVEVDAARQARAAAAIRLVRLGEVSPSTALFLTASPPSELEQASAAGRRSFTAEEREHALELVAGGATWSEAADAIGCSKGLLGDWVCQARTKAGVSGA